MSMAVDDETAIGATGERERTEIGICGTDVQRMTFDPDESRNSNVVADTCVANYIENSLSPR